MRLISTFDALVAIGNISPSGKEKQIYPPAKDTVISVRQAPKSVLPLVADQYFQFTGETGTDQMVRFGPVAQNSRQSRRRRRYTTRTLEFGSNFARKCRRTLSGDLSQPIALLHQ